MRSCLWVVFFVLLNFGAGVAFSQNVGERTLEKEFQAEEGQAIEFDLRTGGAIDITGWDRHAVSVRVERNGRDWEDVEIDFKQTPSGIIIESKFANKRGSHSVDLRFEAKVPRKFNIDLNTMGGGVRITGVEGTFTGKTMGGEIHLSDLKGKADLTTMGGEISIEQSELDGRVKTMGGRVRMRDVTGSIQGSSMGGSVVKETSAASSGNTTRGEAVVSTMGGKIDIADAPDGADVHTMGGNIHIGSAGDHVKAKTMGGNIDLEAVDGWVEATTMGGDITVVMVGDPNTGRRDVTLSSMGGEIRLTLPADISALFDITLAYTRNSHQDYKIVSDFEIKQEETKEWTRRDGSPRKYIYGTGSVGDGRNKIKIETINGDVYLKKISSP